MSDIVQWLTGLGLEKYVPAFSDAEIDFDTLPDLEEGDLKELGLPLGPRRKIWGAIQRLGDANEAPSTNSISPAAPASIAQTSTPSHDAERRHLTVMFVDLVGSTEMAGKIDPEDMRDIITGYQNTIAGIVTRFEGFVAKFMGDGVLCYFGWPIANEDDAERAVRAGLAMIDAIRLSSGPGGVPLATRVGIATGVVIVGDLIGSGATQEAAVVGETPNLAARLQGLAQPDQLVLPKETQSLLGDIFEMEAMGAHSLKGIAEPVEAFAVIGENTRESRFAARQMGMLTPIVGREQELDLMLECWAKAQSGAGQLVVISGEAGIGKSRVTQAAIDKIAEADHIRITYQCSPYHTDSAFYPIIQQMGFAAGFDAGDGVDARLEKLEKLTGADPEISALVALLLGVDATGRYDALDLTPAQIRVRTMQALISILMKQAVEKPLLVVFEDLHWVDPTTLELIDLALDAIADRNILFLATARPNFEHGFGGHPIVTRFALNRLGREQISTIASKLTGGKSLPEEVLQIITSRTDGVPLFVEELTKTILESGVLKTQGDRLVLDGPLNALTIPSTLHDSLMARLDRLQPIKEVAQTAACIGREFKHGLLASISHLSDDDLNTALEGLIKAELIYRRGLPPEATYLFKHALVRDAAYESLLKERRRAIHQGILTALESAADTAPEILAVHADAAGLTKRAMELWETASKAAVARPAYDEAISHLERAISLFLPLSDGGDKSLLEWGLSLRVQLGMALLVRRGYGADETVSQFEQALELSDKVGETPMRYSILYGLWIGKGIRGEHAEAWQRAQELVSQADGAPQAAAFVVANRVAGATCWFMGDLDVARRYLDVAMAHFDPETHGGLANRFGQDIGVTVLIFNSLNALIMGQTRQAAQWLEEAEQLAKSTGHVQTICYTLMIRGLFSLMSGDTASLERCMAEVIPTVQEHHLVVWIGFSAMVSEIIAAKHGDKTSIQRYFLADAALVATKVKMFVPQTRIAAARNALTLGLQDEAVKLAQMTRDLIDQTGETYALPDLHRLQASLAKADGDEGEAEKQLNNALVVARQQGAKLWELRAAIDLAQLWQEQGRSDEAFSLLDPVQKSIADGDCPVDMKIAHSLLGEITA